MNLRITVTITAFIAILLVPTFSYGRAGDNERLWYKYPAKHWSSQALHIGNGYMGASFYGGVKEERFDITEKTMWTGGPGGDLNYNYDIKPGGRDHLNQIRDAIVSGDIAEADSLVYRHFMGGYSSFGAFSMIGNLYFTFADHNGSVSGYKRELDLSQSLAKVSYAMDSVGYEREYFCSYPDRVIVMRFSSNQPGTLGFAMRHKLEQGASGISINNDELLVTGKINGNSREYRVRIKVLHSGGKLEVNGEKIVLSGANSATVIYSAATEYRPVPPQYKGADPDAITSGLISQAAQRSYEQLKRRHIEDYQSLYNRVKLTLASDPDAEMLPTNQRWQNLKKGKQDNTGT